MTQDLLKFYVSTAKNLSKATVNWRELAKVDGKLTCKWVDENEAQSHKLTVDAGGDGTDTADVILVHDFLDAEYGKSKVSVEYKTVSYLPSEKFQQFGLFAKSDFARGSVINGVTGFLAEIKDDEIVAGLNDVSILYSQHKDIQWVMLGPISFINASCKANVEYRQKGNIVFCVALKDIKIGDELTVYYYRHFFGRFNENCLCPYKLMHGDPCPNDPEPTRKRKKLQNVSDVLTPQGTVSSPDQTPVRRIFLEKFPPRRALYDTPANENGSDSETFLSYKSFFGDIESFSSPANLSESSNANALNSGNDSESLPDEQGFFNEPVVECSTPLRLDVFETNGDEDARYDETDIKDFFFQEDGLPLFAGAHSSTESFMRAFETVADKHKMSKIARSDVLKLFARNLPVPNNLFEKLSIPHLPTVSKYEYQNASFCCVDVKNQIEKIFEQKF
ncbi:uncharacterized protein LOC142352001 isoform X1 [Convolutriloba macropyga]|uniref:uncharacterized protein LOC142352001 isoform X1 n=1 Tax=Convolutriloba macropyga TaxID=536237 RepID=UPI003F52107E